MQSQALGCPCLALSTGREPGGGGGGRVLGGLMSDGGTSESAGGERDGISAHNSAISASRFFLAVCAADRRVVTVLCAMLCQQPFIPHDKTSQETSRVGILQHCVKPR